MKTLKAIPFQSGLAFAIMEKVQCGDYYLTESGNLVKANDYTEYVVKRNKIIAQHNLNLEGIPYVELEEDIISLAELQWDYIPGMSTQPKIESIEVEEKMGDEGIIAIAFGECDLVTYQKDGKTYLKVNKINYEQKTQYT
jgi:hypothetical protein